MEALLFWHTFIAIYKITRRLISEAGTLNVHRSLSIRSICLSVCLSVRFLTAVAVFRKTNAIPLCFSIDLVLNFLHVVGS